jgi:hypothetical protein
MSSRQSGSTGAAQAKAESAEPAHAVTEQQRLDAAREAGIPWKKWGPYLSERQWGTVREDYSDNGEDAQSAATTS